MNKMKNICLIAVVALVFLGCRKSEFAPVPEQINPNLNIASAVGIKLESAFVTTEVAMNVKIQTAGTVTVKIFDIANRVVSKEQLEVKVGDNVVKVYTAALPSSAYRIGIFDSNNKMLGITDFNKL